jgi:hypothetical protein
MRKFFPSQVYILMMLSVVLFFPMNISTNAQTPPSPQQPEYYKIKSIYPLPLKRPAVKYSLDQLTFKSKGGEVPTFDGENFCINLMDYKIGSVEEAKKSLSSFLESFKSSLHVDKEMRLNINKTTAKADQKFIDEQIRLAQESTQKRVTGEFKTVSKGSQDMMNEIAQDTRSQTEGTVTVYRFDQYFNEVLIDNTGLSFVIRSENSVVSLQGRFFNDVKPANRNAMPFPAAMKRAIVQIKNENKYENVTGDETGTMVLLPVGEGFKYAWKSKITADGPYLVWIDAETGAVLQLVPDFFFSDNAKGLVFYPDPNTGTKEMTFEVDPSSGGKYTLNLAGVLTMTNKGADGTTGIVTVNDDGSGTANFNVAPINGLVVERTNQKGYNGLFQQVNVYAHIFNERRYYMLLGSQTFPVINASFNNPGGNSFCCPPSYYIGTATVSSSTSCSDVFNAAIDATVIAHEFGHFLNGLQYKVGGGSMTSAINEGLADFWALTNFNTDTFGGWWGHNCPTPVQSGFVPRQSEPLDVFPHHNSQPGASDEAHSAGQIISWALWSSRQGMNDAMDLGTLLINFTVIEAMTSAGISVNIDGSDESIRDSYRNLLQQLAPQYQQSRMVHKLLAGFARAGIFLSQKDALIDIDHSYLNSNSATGPTFTIWTGEDYTFTGETVNTSNHPYNTQFLVEVANDEAFTVNLVNSGWTSGVTPGQGGFATWTLPAANWNTLKTADAIFFRVTTKDSDGSNVRQSWNPGNGFLNNVPAGKAAINSTGTINCSCSASAAPVNSAFALIPLIPIGLLIAIRRRKLSRKQ